MSPLSFVASMGRKLALRGCDVVGDDVRLVGRPSIESRGRLELGRGALLCSRPIATHLATGAEGALFIGDGVTIGYGSSIVAKGLITIGDGTRIGPFAMVCDVEDDEVSGWERTRRPIVIGRDVRIGSKVTVLPGTYICDGADVPAGTVVSGTTSAKGGAPRALAGASDAGATPPSDVSQRIARLLGDIFDRNASAPPSLALERISGWGASGVLRLLRAVEEEFGTTIPDEEWLAIRSLGDLVGAIERHTAHVRGPLSRPTLATGQVE